MKVVIEKGPNFEKAQQTALNLTVNIVRKKLNKQVASRKVS